MDKIKKTTNDIINGIITKKNEKIIKEHMGHVGFRNDVIIESHFNSSHESVNDDTHNKIKNKLDKTKYSTSKKGLIMEVIKKHDFDPMVINLLTATNNEESKSALAKLQGTSTLKVVISNMQALGLS